jgi:hypothetical protein
MAFIRQEYSCARSFPLILAEHPLRQVLVEFLSPKCSHLSCSNLWLRAKAFNHADGVLLLKLDISSVMV